MHHLKTMCQILHSLTRNFFFCKKKIFLLRSPPAVSWEKWFKFMPTRHRYGICLNFLLFVPQEICMVRYFPLFGIRIREDSHHFAESRSAKFLIEIDPDPTYLYGLLLDLTRRTPESAPTSVPYRSDKTD